MALLFDDDQGLIQNVLTLDPGANVLTLNNVQAAQIPSGTTAQRPGSPVNGTLRNNSDFDFIEEYVNGSWQPIFSNGGSSYNTIFDDFLITTSAQVSGFGRFGWRVSTTGTGAAIRGNTTLLTSANNTFGIMELSTGTTTTGLASAFISSNAFLFGYSKFYAEWRVNMPNTSTTAQAYNVRIGFDDVWTTGVAQNGVYFLGTGGNAPVWNCVTINGGTATSTSSGTAIASATWYKLGILMNADGTSVGFYINDTLVVTTTTNIPTGGAEIPNVTGFGAQIVKTAGTTARTLEIDYAQMTCALTTAR